MSDFVYQQTSIKAHCLLSISWLLLLACRGSHPFPVGRAFPAHAQKIVVHKSDVYDLSGYEDEGGGIPFNLFDENENVDPANENKAAENYIPVTSPQPTIHPSIYFPPSRGNRIVTDLCQPYHLTEVYVYDRSLSMDSVRIYTGSMLGWTLKASFVTNSQPGLWGWRKFSLGDSARYVMIQFSSYQTAITEMVLYGWPCPVGAGPALPVSRKGFSKKRMKDFLGVNYFGSVDAKWVKPFHNNRLYAYAMDVDNDTTDAWPAIRYNMFHDAHWDDRSRGYSFFMDTLISQNQANVWYSLMGPAAWMNNKAYASLRPVTAPGMDPENPLSYARHANMMWNLAAFFGHARLDPALINSLAGTTATGRGLMTLYENGNEDDATWTGDRYCGPVAYFAQSSADYDGQEGALGKHCGIQNADPTARLITSGMIGLDTNRVRVYRFLCNTLRKDQKFIWEGGIEYHHYSTNGKHGITPEEDSLRWKLSKTSEATYRIAPEVDCILGENGYDKSQLSRQGTPLIPQYSEEQSQAICILRSINATVFSGFDAYILYWLRDAAVPNDPRTYLTSGIFRQGSGDNMYPLAAWFYISTFVNVLGHYCADSVIREQGPLWVYRYRNQDSPDSVAYLVYCPTHNGQKVKNYPLEIGSCAHNQAREIDFEEGSVSGSSSIRAVVEGKVSIDAGEKPEIILAQQSR